jgi:1-acyl-sn-glycerol-3-phosphate acyltransferase
MRRVLVLLTMIVLTPPLAAVSIVSRAFGVPDRPGRPYRWVTHVWSRAVLWAAGVKIRLHDAERMGDGLTPLIFASNHVSWFDVFALAAVLPRAAFISKAELMRIPIFGRGSQALGTVPIERANRKSAFASYERAATSVRAGLSLAVFPEGTRGTTYALRPFKKGPFVLAIAAAAPVVPVIIHGTMSVMPKGSWRIRPGTVDLHFLEAIPTEGLTYEDRDALMRRVHDRMAEALHTLYGDAGVSASAAGVAPHLTFAPHG